MHNKSEFRNNNTTGNSFLQNNFNYRVEALRIVIHKVTSSERNVALIKKHGLGATD